MIYECAKECAEEYGIKPATMRSWLSGSRAMPDEFIEMRLSYLNDDHKGKIKDIWHSNSNKKAVVFNDVIYESICLLASEINKNNKTINSWLNGDRGMPKKYIEMGLRYATEDEKNILINNKTKREKVFS